MVDDKIILVANSTNIMQCLSCHDKHCDFRKLGIYLHE